MVRMTTPLTTMLMPRAAGSVSSQQCSAITRFRLSIAAPRTRPAATETTTSSVNVSCIANTINKNAHHSEKGLKIVRAEFKLSRRYMQPSLKQNHAGCIPSHNNSSPLLLLSFYRICSESYIFG